MRQKANPPALKLFDPVMKRARELQSTFARWGLHASAEFLREQIAKERQCPFCNAWMNYMTMSPDHAVARSRGGADSWENIDWVCIHCQRVKGNLNADEFRELLAFLAPRPAMAKIICTRLKQAGFWFSAKCRKRA